jgi:signal transduction histidine kinase
VFENILINSIRFNFNNTIEIVIKVSRIEEKGINYCKMEFIDNGIGIEDSRKNIVFSRAFQNGNNVLGIGLGLSLVNKIIQVYRGQIWVEDKVKGDYSKGSNFIILIPEV